MKMEEMSNEQVINGLKHLFAEWICDGNPLNNYLEYEAELLRRLNSITTLTAERDALRKELQSWKDSRDGVMSENEAFALEALNLRCCGNCLNYRYGNLCDGQMISHDSWCDSWQSDNLAKEQRCLSF